MVGAHREQQGDTYGVPTLERESTGEISALTELVKMFHDIKGGGSTVQLLVLVWTIIECLHAKHQGGRNVRT